MRDDVTDVMNVDERRRALADELGDEDGSDERSAASAFVGYSC